VTIEKGKLATSTEKKVKKKIINLDNAGDETTSTDCFLSLVCWLMFARRLCVYDVGLKLT